MGVERVWEGRERDEKPGGDGRRGKERKGGEGSRVMSDGTERHERCQERQG